VEKTTTEVTRSKPMAWSGVEMSKHAYPSASGLVFQKSDRHGVLAIELLDLDLKELLAFIKDNFPEEWSGFASLNKQD
jgi:hypothetical protein